MPNGLSGTRTYRWGGAAFALGNLLFIINKLDEMSRLFLGRWMPDAISGQNPALILFGQLALIIGYLAFYRAYVPCVERPGKIALRLFSGGGILLALGHTGFISLSPAVFPPTVLVYAESLFLLVIIGLLTLLVGLIWFGVLNLRQPVLSAWRWLPLVTGLMGLIGFVGFSGEEITATFLVFRTLFAIGLVGLGVTLARESPAQPALDA